MKPANVLDHATSEIASGSKLGIDATKKIPGEGFKRPWPPLIKMDESVKAKMEKFFASVTFVVGIRGFEAVACGTDGSRCAARRPG